MLCKRLWHCSAAAVSLIFPLLVIMSEIGAGVADPKSKPVKNVLSFGGNGFIGSEVLNALFEDPDQYYSVSLVSRGNWYFDSETRIRPHIKNQFLCDREESDLEFCEELVRYVNSTPKIDVVLDFSAYNPQVLEPTLELLKDKDVGLYVYISSDSIYEVCKNSKIPRLASEDDDQRPDNEDERQTLNEADSYGHEKLQGEDLLRSPDNKIPYVIFRLPDVIGSRDTTDRWWTYQMWIQFYNFIKVPLHVPVEYRTLQTSYVYVKDVAQAILLALNKPEAWNTVYNLGNDRTLTLQEFLEDMSKEVGVSVEFDVGEFHLFPSVLRGAVSIEKAKKVLGFKPTPWEQILKETVPFYKEGFYKFQSERDDSAHQLTRFVVPRHRKGEFLKLIDESSANPSTPLQEYLSRFEGSTNRRLGEGVTGDQLFEEMMTHTEL